jgi:hypothetical protein
MKSLVFGGRVGCEVSYGGGSALQRDGRPARAGSEDPHHSSCPIKWGLDAGRLRLSGSPASISMPSSATHRPLLRGFSGGAARWVADTHSVDRMRARGFIE